MSWRSSVAHQQQADLSSPRRGDEEVALGGSACERFNEHQFRFMFVVFNLEQHTIPDHHRIHRLWETNRRDKMRCDLYYRDLTIHCHSGSDLRIHCHGLRHHRPRRKQAAKQKREHTDVLHDPPHLVSRAGDKVTAVLARRAPYL